MNDAEIRETLGRIDPDFPRWYQQRAIKFKGNAVESGYVFLELAKRQAALEKIIVLVEARDDDKSCLDAILNIARRASKGE